MKFRKLFGLAVLLSVGCNTYPDSYEAYISPQFSTEQQSIIIRGIKAWEDKVPVHIHIHIADYICAEHTDAICIIPATKAEVVAVLDDPTAVGNCQTSSNTDSSQIMISTTLTEPSKLQETATHESGHSMGLRHTGQDTIMAANYRLASHIISCTDVQQWFEVRGMQKESCQ